MYPPTYLQLPVQPGFYQACGWWMANTNTFIGYIDNAYNQHKYVHLQFHAIRNVPGPLYTNDTPPDVFDTVLARCDYHGFKVVPISEILASSAPLPRRGSKRARTQTPSAAMVEAASLK